MWGENTHSAYFPYCAVILPSDICSGETGTPWGEAHDDQQCTLNILKMTEMVIQEATKPQETRTPSALGGRIDLKSVKLTDHSPLKSTVSW